MRTTWAVWVLLARGLARGPARFDLGLAAALGTLAACATDAEPTRDAAHAEDDALDAEAMDGEEEAGVGSAATGDAATSDASSARDARRRDAAVGSMNPDSGPAAPSSEGVDPASITLRAVGANGTVGLDWPRVRGATGYRVYFASAAGVNAMNGMMLEAREPGLVHRGLANGTALFYAVRAVLASGEGPLSNEATATPSGEWVLEQLGSGDFDDVASGARVMPVPLERRVHVLLFAEGYLESELATFHDAGSHASGNNDVDRWLAELSGVEPYSRLKEAFVIWVLPRASAAHLGEGDTAFDVGVSNGAVSNANASAAALFGALDAQGTDSFPLATLQTANMVGAFLLYDPARRRAGVSGVTTSIRNPSNTMQSIRAAFGAGHAHEFTHAFANVGDEYMEVSSMAPRGGTFSNLSASNRCDDLPWAHLLEGRGINMTAGLVGAFGSPEQGYHSELYCMMNGTHENGQFWCAEGDERYTSLTLRPNQNRLCNICREITAYRVFERTGLLAGSAGLDTWKRTHRPAFFERFGFSVPAGALPQTLMCSRNGPAKPVYEACVP